MNLCRSLFGLLSLVFGLCLFMWITLLFCFCYTVCLDTDPACLTTICKIKLAFGFYTLPASPRYRILCLPKVQRLSENTDRTMDPASRLFRLRQGNQPTEDYVTNFCELCHLVDFNDIALKDIFHHGLKDSLKYLMPRHTPHWTLEQYIDFALRLSGSPFTVGVADEEPCYPPLSAKPGNFSVMSGIIQVTSEPFHAMPPKPESCHAKSAKPKPAHAMPAAPGPAHAMPAAPGPAHTMPAAPESASVMSALLQPAHKMAAIPEPVHKMAAIPKPAHKMAAIPEPAHNMAAIPKPVHKMAAIPKPVHKMAAPSESLAKMAAMPEPHQAKIISSACHPIISATSKANQVMPDSPVSSQASKSSQVAAAFPELSQVSKSSQVAAVFPESSQVSESSQDTAVLHEPSQDTAVLDESSQDTAVVLHESSQDTAVLDESSQDTAVVLHESSQDTAVVLHESSQDTAVPHESSHVTGVVPESSQETAVLPEPNQVPSDLPKSHHVSAEPPEPMLPSHAERTFPSQKSIASTPLRSTDTPLSTVLPVMAIAIFSVWAAHCAPEASSVYKFTPIPPEVSAPAVEPPKEVASIYELTATSAHKHSACHVTAKKAYHKLSTCHATTKEIVSENTALLWMSLVPLWISLLLPALPALQWPPFMATKQEVTNEAAEGAATVSSWVRAPSAGLALQPTFCRKHLNI
ncbi:hypothetical protein M9458_052230 [Cirrhinus mrigala]|uniref:Retrotransposon gag domain-containing protein n=1 Tax=Cirrhinus mrigala TaxID=683832 RepID=A0ABD0MR42_CIRMR